MCITILFFIMCFICICIKLFWHLGSFLCSIGYLCIYIPLMLLIPCFIQFHLSFLIVFFDLQQSMNFFYFSSLLIFSGYFLLCQDIQHLLLFYPCSHFHFVILNFHHWVFCRGFPRDLLIRWSLSASRFLKNVLCVQ